MKTKIKNFILALSFVMTLQGGANAFQAGVSVDYIKDINENVIYTLPIDFSNLPEMNFTDIGYFRRFKPLNMLSSLDAANFKAAKKTHVQVYQGVTVPSVYNVSLKNGGEVRGESVVKQSLEELIKKNPGKAEYIYAYAVKLKNEGRYKEAIIQVDRALALNYNYALGYFLKGDILRMTGDFKGASKEYSKTLEINPYCTDAYFNIAKMLEIYGNIELALAYYKMAYETSPNDLEIRNQILKLTRQSAQGTEPKVSMY